MKISTLMAAWLGAMAMTAAPTAEAGPLPKLCLSSEAETACQSLGRVDFANTRPTVIVRHERITP